MQIASDLPADKCSDNVLTTVLQASKSLGQEQRQEVHRLTVIISSYLVFSGDVATYSIYLNLATVVGLCSEGIYQKTKNILRFNFLIVLESE